MIDRYTGEVAFSDGFVIKPFEMCRREYYEVGSDGETMGFVVVEGREWLGISLGKVPSEYGVFLVVSLCWQSFDVYKLLLSYESNMEGAHPAGERKRSAVHESVLSKDLSNESDFSWGTVTLGVVNPTWQNPPEFLVAGRTWICVSYIGRGNVPRNEAPAPLKLHEREDSPG